MRCANLLGIQGLIKRTSVAVLGRERFPVVRLGAGVANSKERSRAWPLSERATCRSLTGRVAAGGYGSRNIATRRYDVKDDATQPFRVFRAN